MALQTALGAKVFFSPTLPATQDEKGFKALTYIQVGELESLPELSGKSDVKTFDNLTTGLETKLAGIYRAGSGTLTVGYDQSDKGQLAIEAACLSRKKGVFKIVLANGVTFFRAALVLSNNPKPSGDDIIKAEIELEFEGQGLKTSN